MGGNYTITKYQIAVWQQSMEIVIKCLLEIMISLSVRQLSVAKQRQTDTCTYLSDSEAIISASVRQLYDDSKVETMGYGISRRQ